MSTAAELARLEERVNNHIRFFWVVVTAGFGWLAVLSYQLYQIKGIIRPVAAQNAATQLKVAAIDPTDPTSQASVVSAIASAKRVGTPISTSALAIAGRSFVDASAQNPRAWETVKTLMEYRTSVNSLTFVFPRTATPAEATQFTLPTVAGEPLPQVSRDPAGVPIAQAARMEEIGKPTNLGVAYAPAHLIVTGGVIHLDRMDMAHLIFVGVTIHYSGSPTKLEDVLFVNCVFVFDNIDQSRQLAQEIISSKTVDFQTS